MSAPGDGRRITPGRVLRRVLDEQNLSHDDLAKRLAGLLDRRQISQVARNAQPMTPRTALLLEIGTGVPVEEWLLLYWRAYLPVMRAELLEQIAAGGRTVGHHARTMRTRNPHATPKDERRNAKARAGRAGKARSAAARRSS